MRQYIGRRFPTCWAFVRCWYWDQFRITMPETVMHCRLKAIDEPEDGDLVMLASRSRHCGVWYAGGVLHYTAAQGVIHDKRVADYAFYRLTGIY